MLLDCASGLTLMFGNMTNVLTKLNSNSLSVGQLSMLQPRTQEIFITLLFIGTGIKRFIYRTPHV